jgi:hypothetical protein
MSTKTSNVPSKKILIAGMPRSGSTRLYNFIRLLCDKKGKTYSDIFEEWDKAKQEIYNVQKCHWYIEELHHWADIIITTKRSLLDVMASTRLFGVVPIDTSDKFAKACHQYSEWYWSWKSYSDIEISYENDIIQDIRNIFKVINVNATNGEIREASKQAEALPLGGVMRRTTLLSERHRNNGGVGYYGEVLSKEEIQYITKHFPHLVD